MEDTKKQPSPLGNLDPNVISAFSYLFPFITGIAFFLIEKENKTIRFHSMQSVLFWLVVFIISSLADTLYGIFFIGPLLISAVRIATVVLWLYLMWKAYNKEQFELPYIGKIAKEQANK